MRLLLILISTLIVASEPNVSLAELCSPVSVSVDIAPGQGSAESEFPLYELEAALDRGDLQTARQQKTKIEDGRLGTQFQAMSAAKQMCNKNIWEAFNYLVDLPDQCRSQQINTSSGTTFCRMAPGTLKYLPAPTTISCLEPINPTLEIDYIDDDMYGSSSTIEIQYSEASSLPSSPTITMQYDCEARSESARFSR
jgi:hypothetical protein